MAKTQYKLYGAFYEIDNLNLLTTSVEEFVDMKSAAETRQLYETVKGYIVKLIPCASTWSDDQFSNDAAIIMHLKNLYKIDYIECPDSFDSLIKAFDAIDADEDVEHRLLVVGDMTLALAKVIWPYETEKQIENLFCWGCTQISKYIRFGRERGADMSYNIAAAQQEIHSTWAYRQITSWNEDKSYKLSMDTKKWLYQAEIGIF